MKNWHQTFIFLKYKFYLMAGNHKEQNIEINSLSNNMKFIQKIK